MKTTTTPLTKESIVNKLPEINSAFKVIILAEELLVSEYSPSSAADFLASRVEEELNGEWSTATILQKVKHAMHKGQTWSDDALLTEIFLDKKDRRKQLKTIGEKMGYPIERLLRPPKSAYGICLVLLFLCIPAAIGISWFFSSLIALILIFTLYYLDRNGNDFRSKTLIEFAEEIEWKRNMELRKRVSQINSEDIKAKLHKILTS
ncbi:MAG: hypothetical protein ACKOW8_10835 [Flavobacteriales bacterium]